MFRSLGKSKIAFILAILFGISLFFFRQGSSISNIFNSDNVVAKVSGTPISTTKFNRTLQMNIQKFNQMLGKSISNEEIRNFQIHSLALGALINDAVFENEYDKLGFKLDDKVIAKKTKETIPKLFDNNNKLDEVYLNQFLNQQQLKIEDIVQIIHYETRDQYFSEALLDISYPKYFSSKINKYNNHEREVNYTKFPIELIDIDFFIQNNKSNLDELVKNYYHDNINQYMTDEKRNVEYILVDKENYKKKFTPSIDEIKDYYNNNLNFYLEKGKRSFAQFNFKTKNEAAEFKKQIEYLITYDEIISYANQNDIKYNFFNNLTIDEVLDETSEILFSLNVNDQSSIIESTIANHIIILQNIEKSKQLTLSEVQDNINSTITEIDTNNYFTDLENNISQDILKSMSLNELKNNYDLKLSKIENLTKNYEKFNEDDILFFKSITNHAFTSNLDFINDIVVLDENKFYFFKVTNIAIAKPIEFNNISEKIFTDWKTSKRIQEIEKIFEKNKSNSNFINEIESKYNIVSYNIKIKRNDNILPRIFVEKIFSNNLSELSLTKVDSEIFISQTLNILIDKNMDDFSFAISIFDDLRNSLNSELIKNVKISTNDRLINTILNNYK